MSSILAQKPDQVDWSAFGQQDWQQFVKTAHAHGVAPLLWYTLEDIGWPAAIPMQVRHTLRATFYQTTAQNTLIYQELERILDALQDIPVIVLKGAALANTLYPHIGTRPMVDIDLLVPRQALIHAAQALHPLGYHLISVQHHLVFVRAGSTQNTVVEIHWLPLYNVLQTHTHLIEWFWSQRESWQHNLTDIEAYQFSPTAHLLYLVAHLTSHHSSQHRLIWMHDLHLMITKYAGELEWDTLMLQADRAHLKELLEKTLRILQTQYETHIPSWTFFSEPAADHAGLSNLDVSAPSEMRDTSVWYALRFLDWPLRLYLVLLVIFPRPMYIKQRYSPQPGWLWPLYYPYRWLDLSHRGISLLIQQCRLGR
jgi:hypothetical protein